MFAVRFFFVHLRSAADRASANAVPAIACQDGVARRATARRPTAHASRHRARFAADAATASAATVTAMSGTISDIPDNIARSVL